jgi:cytochrome bd-type quinol oxidase subunit 2
MIQTLKNFITRLSITTLLVVPMLTPAVAHAAVDVNGSLCEGANLSVGSTDCSQDGDPKQRVNNLLTTVINIFSLVVGVIAVVMIIIGGLKYITSGGESSNITGAKNTILYAVIGLVVVALAQFIVRFVLVKVTQDSTGG